LDEKWAPAPAGLRPDKGVVLAVQAADAAAALREAVWEVAV
jgi:hypothetical protein